MGTQPVQRGCGKWEEKGSRCVWREGCVCKCILSSWSETHWFYCTLVRRDLRFLSPCHRLLCGRWGPLSLSLSPFKGWSPLFKLDCHQVTKCTYLRTSYSPRGKGPACSKSWSKCLEEAKGQRGPSTLRSPREGPWDGRSRHSLLSATQGASPDFVSSTVYRWLNRRPRTIFLKWGFLFYVFLN